MKFVNEHYFDIPISAAIPTIEMKPKIAPLSFVVHNLIPMIERERINKSINNLPWEPVGITGMKGKYFPGDRIGSYRLSNYNEKYVFTLWTRLAPYLSTIKGNHLIPTDHNNQIWEPIGVSPLLRFVKYETGGCLVSHYDAPYIQDERTRTLLSLVIYIDSTSPNGGTRFLLDPQQQVPLNDRNLSDGELITDETQVRLLERPSVGSGLIFPHRLWHDAEPVIEGTKTIIRTDILYKAFSDD